MLNSNQAFLLVQKLGFTLGVKAEIEKKISIRHMLLMYVELHGFVLAPRLKQEPI